MTVCILLCFPGGESKKSSSQDDSLQYFCKMDKKLVMQPAVLVEKASGPDVQPSTGKGTCVIR